MKPLIFLISATLVSLAVLAGMGRGFDIYEAMRLGMSGMLLFTASGHVAFAGRMQMMLPVFVPYKSFLIGITGIIEVAAAVGLLIPDYTRSVAIFLMVFFVLILPANIFAARHRINYLNADKPGPGPNYLWLRIPAQIIFIGWVYVCGVQAPGI